MKKIRIVQTVVAVFIAAMFVSCSPGNQYHSYPPPPPRASISLIIDAGPGIVVHRYRDGRYYYRASNGYIYWRGYGNRYYLDRKYISPYHQHRQYNQWKHYHNRRR